jgi:hypothetical protein
VSAKELRGKLNKEGGQGRNTNNHATLLSH